MNAWEMIEEASVWAPHKREKVLSEAVANDIIKKAWEENWEIEKVYEALPGMTKEAILGLAGRILSGLGRAGAAGARVAQPVGGAALKTWGRALERHPIWAGISTLGLAQQIPTEARKTIRWLGPYAGGVTYPGVLPAGALAG